MKTKLCRVVIILALTLASLMVFSSAAELGENNGVQVVGYDDNTDYMQEIILALQDGSNYGVYAAKIYEEQRNLKIDTLGLSVKKTDFFSGRKTVQEILDEIDIYINGAPSGYTLTDEERTLVEKAVMAEAGGECYEGKMMIAQCILDGALNQEVDVATFIKTSKISVSSKEPYASCCKAVADVFDKGLRVTEEMADIWYAPALTTSEWHESQIYITTIGAHRFFKKIEE